MIPEDWPRGGLVGLVARDPVRQKTPGRFVPLRRKEVAPVLPDEPRTEEGHGLGPACQFPEFGEPAGEEDCKHGESQRELVDAKTADVYARTETVAFQAQHGATLVSGG